MAENKRYDIKGTRLWGLTPTEYRDIVKAAKNPYQKGEIFVNTQAHYFRVLPEKSIYIFYPLYLIAAIGLILSARVAVKVKEKT